MLRVRRLAGRRDYKVLLRSYIKTGYYYRKAGLLLVLIALVIVGITWQQQQQQFIIIADNEYIDIPMIEQILSNHSLYEAKQKILSIDSIYSIDIDRSLTTIIIQVVANVPQYTYMVDNEMQFVNKDGELFRGTFESNEYIQIHTPKELLKDSVAALSKYEKLFTQTPYLKIKEYITHPVEKLIVHTGAQIIIGNNHQMHRLQKMLKYAGRIKFRQQSIIDLRYKNGFAKTN